MTAPVAVQTDNLHVSNSRSDRFTFGVPEPIAPNARARRGRLATLEPAERAANHQPTDEGRIAALEMFFQAVKRDGIMHYEGRLRVLDVRKAEHAVDS
jgi:hypothetical protein